jgi:hypothetical protein
MHGKLERGHAFERAASDGWVPPLIASSAPWSHTTDPVNGDVSNVTRRRVVHRRKLDIAAKVGASKLPKQFRSTALRDSAVPMDDDVLIEAKLVARAGLNGQRDARVTADVSNLPVLGQVRGDDLIAVQADPHDRDLRSSVWLERHQMRQRSSLEYSSSRIGNRRHGVKLPIQDERQSVRVDPSGLAGEARIVGYAARRKRLPPTQHP